MTAHAVTWHTGHAVDVLRTLEGADIAAAVTSPPYVGQRIYGDHADEIGRTPTLAGYVAEMVIVMHHLRRALRPDAAVWLNIGDKANGSGGSGGDWARSDTRIKGRAPKVRVFRDDRYYDGTWIDAPGAVLRGLLLDGWRLRAEVIWDKGQDAAEDLRHVRRPRTAHEKIYLLAPTAAPMRFYPSQLVETGTVWHFPPSRGGKAGHLAPFPIELPRRAILATTLPGDTVIDPFAGSGTTLRAALELGRRGVGIDLYEKNPFA